MKVFLGGTVNGSKWRNEVMEKLTIDYFDPVVEEWNDAAYERELSERRNCHYLLYVLTPKMTGFYAIAEVTDDSYQRPDRTLYCYLPNDEGESFTDDQIAEFERLGKIVIENGATWLKDLDEVIEFLNSAQVKDENDVTHGHDVFMCYGRKESKDFANRITNRLSEKHYSVFQDLNEIPLMIDSEEYVYQQILRADNFVYIISPNAVRSEYCKKELDFAIRFNKRIIPIVHHRLGRDIGLLDDIVAKKSIIEHKKIEEKLPECVVEIADIIETDRDYVRMHSKLLFKSRNWDFGGKRQADLMFGEERKEAVKWSKQTSESLSALQIQLNYIQASKKISLFMLPLMWLHQKTKAITQKRAFDQIVLVFSLANPLALGITLVELYIKETGVKSIGMWFIFFAIQLALTFDGIKNKNLGLFISMVLSMIITTLVIIQSYLH